MKNNSAKANVIAAYNYRGHTIYVCDHTDGYYAGVFDADGNYIDCTPYRNDMESVKEAAENIVVDKVVKNIQTSIK